MGSSSIAHPWNDTICAIYTHKFSQSSNIHTCNAYNVNIKNSTLFAFVVVYVFHADTCKSRYMNLSKIKDQKVCMGLLIEKSNKSKMPSWHFYFIIEKF